MRDERSTKAREFSEAQQHIGRLMSVMGFKPDSGHSKPSKPRSKSTMGPSPITSAQQQTHSADEPTESLLEDPETTSFDSVTPHLVGRSPKRARDSTYAMVETLARRHEKRAKNPSRVGSMGPHSERRVLGEADQNSQPSSQSSRRSNASQGETFEESQYMDENHLQGIDLDMDLELTRDFIFTSTSLSQTNDHLPSQILPSWSKRDTLAIRLTNVPKETSAVDLWEAFHKEGSIFGIDLFEDSHGNRRTEGKIRFKPPPATDFWKTGIYEITLPDGRVTAISIRPEFHLPYSRRIDSPVGRDITYPVELKIPIASMDIGVLVDEKTMLPMRTVGLSADEHPFLLLDLKSRAMMIYFQLPILFNSKSNLLSGDKYSQYRLKIPLVQVTRILQSGDPASNISHLIVLDSPPMYFRRATDIPNTFVDDNSWRDSDSWYRQTNIVHNPLELAGVPTSLRKLKPIIDIGRWNVLRVTFPKSFGLNPDLSLVCNILRDYNVRIEETDSFSVWDGSKERPPAVWNWIDLSKSSPQTESSSLGDLLDHTYLEVCLSHGYLSEFTMSQSEARKILEHVATEKKVYFDPMKIFNLIFIKGTTNAKIPSHCCYMRSARVTPSTVYFTTPTHSDRFLRVRFTDEKLLGRISASVDNTRNEIFTRVKRTLANGIVIGDMHYEFLAFGNSQFREHGAYFFAGQPGLTAANIRAWMGTLGQCFSTTRAIAGSSVKISRIDDIVRNGYTFSDGVGRISRFLAQMTMSELKIRTPNGEPPKGMLTVSSQAQPQEVHIRKSQDKFEANHSGLEIIRWSQFSIAALNRQLIIVLSTLGIPDEVFRSKLKDMLQGLDEAQRNPNQMTLIVIQEPFLTSILTLWRAWHLKYLKEKAKIAIEKGANLLGCMDETGSLKGHFNNIPGKDASVKELKAALPEIFVQVSNPEKEGKYEIIEGLCILARNPSLHPGDIRVVNAVNVPALRHLQDVVVLPQTGDRDIASMCSGGDLDGDDYLIIWDQDLVPEEWFREPMTYTSNAARDLDHDVTVDEITSFFVTYMKNDCLPQVAHAHLAWADWLQNGVNEEKCIKLAQLHSDAVDYNKSGNPAIMTRNLRPRVWPHFMEKNHLPKDKIYHSRKILGQLYDAVERIDFRILNCGVQVTADIYQFARDLKVSYDESIRRIMAQHEIKTDHANMSKDYKFHEELGALSSALREGFKNKCYEKVGGREFEQIAPLAVAMYRITHEEMSAALDKHRRENPPDERLFHRRSPSIDKLPLISFPWIFPHILGKIAMRLLVNDLVPGPMLPGLRRGTRLIRTFATGVESLENLLDFGLSETCNGSSSESPTTLINDESHAENEDLLLEWDGSANTENIKPSIDNAVISDPVSKLGDGEEGAVVEIVEEEIVEDDDGLQPTALDKLSRLLEI
ncbi:RdRP-domain-containing protein [Aspergillus taichungensis]|uniref:RNA-dependent RNA polymerase n=1 Tax=Aspergillus taichungensis TaxID=482145 RepID=A0A2J5HES7_9EURO|nr:RdRP-domain-containing protein [Aspergillus taichungensis]